MEHYLDNSATTKTSEKAARAAFEIMTQNYGNPSSLHGMGIKAENELRLARKTVALRMGASDEEVFFTSGGTEANNLALFGTAYANIRRGKKLVVSSVEHSSVIEAAKRLEAEGFNVAYINPRSNGIIHPADVAAQVDGETALVSVMLVNNESGAVMPVKDIFEAAKLKNPSIICHTDAVQAFGKLEIKARRLGAELISVSAHKVHAPKGCGAVYIKKGVRLVSRQYGGEQEKKVRPGTEALPSIAAFGVACGEFDIRGNFEKVEKLNAYARERLGKIDGVLFNSPSSALPYVLNISAGRVRSETMLHFLEERGVYVSSGSACAKGKPSHVLSAMGFDKTRADSALRISFSKYNTEQDVDALCEGIALGLKVLAHR
ncbi:MAG TPA: cysteine desulfurase [Ruminococcaceae bacterium]|nr:cysteine desulfurase [Oscillospiraceae bacterium]